MGARGWTVLITIASIVFGLVAMEDEIMDYFSGSEDRAFMRAVAKAEKAESERQYQLLVGGAMSLRNAMRDPDSFKLESARITVNDTLCYIYRSRNGFGGMNRQRTVFVASKNIAATEGDAGFAKLWNGNCTSGDEMVDTINRALKHARR